MQTPPRDRRFWRLLASQVLKVSPIVSVLQVKF
jgi:hypothetical protein